MEVTDDQEKIRHLEKELEELECQDAIEAAAILNLLVLICTPPECHGKIEDTKFTVLFELLFELASPFGLLANLASIISVSDHWRLDVLKNSTIDDAPWVLALNSVALASGCLGNVFMYFHQRLWVSRYTTLMCTLGCYSSSVIIYVSLLAACEYEYFDSSNTNFHRTQGYWQAVCATALYSLAAIAISIHLYYFRGKDWNNKISKRQNQLMTLCILYIAWIAIMAAAFQAPTMLQTTYAQGVYFAVISFLTLGYGDVVPTNNLSKALSIPMIYLGILLGGLVSITIFQASLNSAYSRSINAGIQKTRKKVLRNYETLKKSGQPPRGDEACFKEMRHIVERNELAQTLQNNVMTIAWLAIFWLIGALIFMYTEGWLYFDSFYMCAISIVGIGYGDYIPESSGGRAVLIHWALIALPTMAAAVSGLTSVFYVIMRKKPRIYLLIARLFSSRLVDEKVDAEKRREEMRNNLMNASGGVVHRKMLPNLQNWQYVLKIAQSKENTQFSYELWYSMVTELFQTERLPDNFWISDISPIRMARLDEKRLLTLLAVHLVKQEEANQKNNRSSSAASSSSSVTKFIKSIEQIQI